MIAFFLFFISNSTPDRLLMYSNSVFELVNGKVWNLDYADDIASLFLSTKRLKRALDKLARAVVPLETCLDFQNRMSVIPRLTINREQLTPSDCFT